MITVNGKTFADQKSADLYQQVESGSLVLASANDASTKTNSAKDTLADAQFVGYKLRMKYGSTSDVSLKGVATFSTGSEKGKNTNFASPIDGLQAGQNILLIVDSYESTNFWKQKK